MAMDKLPLDDFRLTPEDMNVPNETPLGEQIDSGTEEDDDDFDEDDDDDDDDDDEDEEN